MKELQLYISSQKSDDTKATYEKNIKRWFCYQKIETIEDIINMNAIDIDLYIDDMKMSGLSDYSVYAYSIAVKNFIKFLEDRNILKEKKFLARLEKPKKKEGSAYLNSEKSVMFLHSLKKDFDKAIYCFALDTGLRFSEIKNIKIKELVSVVDGGLVEVVGKGDKKRVVGFSEITMNFINTYIQNRKADSDLLFCTSKGNPIDCSNMNKSLKLKMKDCGIENYKDFHMHSLRHSFASVKLEQGENIKVISEQMGHSSVSTTEVYLHLNKNEVAQRMIGSAITNMIQ